MSIPKILRKSAHESSEKIQKHFILNIKIWNTYLEQYHMGVNSYWIGIEKFESEWKINAKVQIEKG